jgi:CheY-like chemotaxis protein
MITSGRFLRSAADRPADKGPRSLKVLVVEDDPRRCMELEDLLRNIGHSVVARAASVESVSLSLARLRDIGIVPDVAVMDARWNEAPARRVLLALKTRGIPVVVEAGREVGDTMPRGSQKELGGTTFSKETMRDALDAISRFGRRRSRPVSMI